MSAKALLEFEGPNGPIRVEAEESAIQPSLGPTRVALPPIKGFDEALKTIKPVALAVLAELSQVSAHEVEVELAFKFAAESTVLLATLSGESHIRVVLKWKATDSKTS